MIVEPRPSAGICLLREAGDGCEVLMVRRGTGARFMGGAWVFPGGAVDTVDRGEEAAAALPDVPVSERPTLAAAVRELVEEAGVWMSDPPQVLAPGQRPHGGAVFHRATGPGPPLAVGGMVPFVNWVTPTAVPVRFDARFYVTAVDGGLAAEPDGDEVVDARWVEPGTAIGWADAGRFELPFPTRRTLRRFTELGSAASIVRHARTLERVEPITPRLRFLAGGVVEAVLPDEPGYEELDDIPADRGMLDRATGVRSAGGEPIPELEPLHEPGPDGEGANR